MDRWVGKVAVVTGASSGIGAAIAESLVNAGLQVAGVARRKDRLEELAEKLENKPGKLYPVQADLTKECEIIQAFDYIVKHIGPVSVLVNNAGSAQLISDLAHGNTEVWKHGFQLNVLGLSIATREAIKSMEKNNIDGHIIHINSVVGHRVIYFQNINVYPATKFAVTALAETLRQELDASASKIKVTDLSPGLVETEMGMGSDPHPQVSELRKQFFAGSNYLLPADVADSVLYVLSTPPHVQIRELMIAPFDAPKRDFSQ